MGRIIVWGSQGSSLGPLLFNMFLFDLFYFLEGTDRASYTDDTTSYNASLTQEIFLNKSQQISSIFFKWFNLNVLGLTITIWK